MPSSFEQFRQQIESAAELINKNTALSNAKSVADDMLQGQAIASIVDTQSLLDRCNAVCEKHETKKPTIRVIHHLACSGGTLISKCIAAMPNVYLLSEVHPYTDLAIGKEKPKYAPSDIISLTKYAGIPKQRELAGKIFKQSVDLAYEHVTQMGGILVLRDHTHADFNTQEPVPSKSALVELLEEDYEVKSVLTLRDPIDSYASLVNNGWVHFEPKSFDEYCRRLLLLIELFKHEQIFKYEDFVSRPVNEMKLLADELELPCSESFEQIFSIFKVTGDSGRSGTVIETRARRSITDETIVSIRLSQNFKKLAREFNYGISGEVE